jgi:tetratricopeptide (TPR) repeat protein
MEQLREAWTSRHRITEIVGELGIGKTRLVAELVKSVPSDVTVLWGRCSEDWLGSYLPFVEILRYVIDNLDTETLRAAMGPRGELIRLVPELADRLGDLPLPTKAEAGSEQRMLFEAVSALLSRWTPMILVIEDLHWADQATLSLLAYLVRDQSLPGLVTFATARASERDSKAGALMAELGRDVEIDRIQPPGLNGPELGILISDLVGCSAPSGLLESVAAATEGNPFFVEELTMHLVNSGTIGKAKCLGYGEEARHAGVPERVREMVVRRLLSLSSDAIELLSVGAVVGREFELSLAAAASGMSGTRLIDASDDAVLSGMVVETGPGRLGFSHALVRDAISSRMTFSRRADVHRRVSEAIEDQWPANPSMAAELARHWGVVAAIDPTATVAAATWAVRAGDVALASAAADEAVARYEQASTLWAKTSIGYVDALIRLGSALQYQGRPDEADARFREATQLAVLLGNPVLQAHAAIGLGRRYPYWETDGARIDVLEAALSALGGDGQSLRVVLMGMIVTHLIIGFRPEQAQRRDILADELLEIAANTETVPELLLAIGQIRIYDCIEDPAILAGVADRLLQSARSHNDLRVEAGARFAQAISDLDSGDMSALRSASDEYSKVTAVLGDPRGRSNAATVSSTIAFIEGRYDDAAARSDEALELGQLSGDFNAQLVHYAQGLLRAVDQGLAGEVLPLLVASDDYQQIAAFDAGTALCAAFAGDLRDARTRLVRLLATGFAGAPRGADWLAPTAFLAHTCVLIGAVQEAEQLYDALSRTQAKVVRVGPIIGWWGPVDHHLGCLAALLGRDEEAERHLTSAWETEKRMGARPFASRTLAALSRVWEVRDSRRSSWAAREAVDLARSVGAAGIETEVLRSVAPGAA